MSGTGDNALLELFREEVRTNVQILNDGLVALEQHIDRLAEEGMRFTDAYSACTVCSPTLPVRPCTWPTSFTTTCP